MTVVVPVSKDENCGILTEGTVTYSTIQPPFTLRFKEMSKRDLKDYAKWFQDILPQRLRELERAIAQTPGFEGWQPNLTPASLDLLGGWFSAQVETRPRSEGETQEIQSRSRNPIEVAGEELTNRTFSLAVDVGMYLGQLFLHNHPTLRWDQPLGSKAFVDYGQPVLIGFGAVPFNPVRMLVTFAYGVASKKETGTGLREIYDIWSKLVT